MKSDGGENWTSGNQRQRPNKQNQPQHDQRVKVILSPPPCFQSFISATSFPITDMQESKLGKEAELLLHQYVEQQ